MNRFLLLLLTMATLIGGCGRSWTWADYMAIHKDGIQKSAASRHMNAHYAEVDNFIVHFGFGKQPLEWQTVAFIDERFELTLVAPVTVDYSTRTVTPAGSPTFHLWAAKRIIPGPGTPEQGGWGCEYDTKLGKTFGLDEWSRFANSGFDLTTLGIPKAEIHPVPHWKEYVRACRKDRVQIK